MILRTRGLIDRVSVVALAACCTSMILFGIVVYAEGVVVTESRGDVSPAPIGVGVSPVTTDTLSFDGDSAYRFAVDQCNMGPRPSGTPAGWATGDYIMGQLRGHGWDVYEQEFTYETMSIRNIIAGKGTGPVVILGAHYDTRPIADKDAEHKDEPIVGANDGASGVAVLLELARVLDPSELNWQVWLAFFDAEDRGHVDGWPFSVGSEYLASSLPAKPEYMILVDMVGDLDQSIYWEANSDAGLLRELWDVADRLGYDEYFIPEPRWALTDDHIPFVKRGIASVDIIDFDYPYWHTTQDTCDKIGPDSLERVGKVVQTWLAEKAQ